MWRFCIASFGCLWLLQQSADAQHLDRVALGVPILANLDLASGPVVDEVATLQATSNFELQTSRLEEGPSLVPPLVTLALGAVSTMIGVGLGLGPTIHCDGVCSPTPWTGGFIIGGVAIMTFGLLWSEWVLDERHELEIHRRMRGSGQMAKHPGTSWRF